MSKWVIEMPESWRPGACESCGRFRHFCRDRFKVAGECPYANAKKAVEVKSIAGYDLSAVSGGKLWATEEE